MDMQLHILRLQISRASEQSNVIRIYKFQAKAEVYALIGKNRKKEKQKLMKLHMDKGAGENSKTDSSELSHTYC